LPTVATVFLSGTSFLLSLFLTLHTWRLLFTLLTRFAYSRTVLRRNRLTRDYSLCIFATTLWWLSVLICRSTLLEWCRALRLNLPWGSHRWRCRSDLLSRSWCFLAFQLLYMLTHCLVTGLVAITLTTERVLLLNTWIPGS
jgi:hypothetical protein